MSNIREIQVNDWKVNRFKYFPSNRVFTTKYTPFTFLPCFLFNELSRPANMFFLLIIFVQQIDPSDPDKFTTIIPLSAVLGFTAVKEIYEELVSKSVKRNVFIHFYVEMQENGQYCKLYEGKSDPKWRINRN